MEGCCDLQVDVNGEETFMVDKAIICSYSGRLSKLFGKSTSATGNFKVIFNDFPGGAESFELMSRFCYNNSRTDISPSKTSLLHCVAHFMEMKNSVSGNQNLLAQTEKSLEQINYWIWSDLLVALNQCQYLLPVANSSGLIEKLMDSLVGRLVGASDTSSCPSTSSPDSSGFRFSCDTRSIESLKNSFSRATWWFDDLLVFNPTLLDMLIKSLISRNFDHVTISRFLFYYHKSKYYNATLEEKCKIVETVIEMLYILDQSSVSCKSLFMIYRVALTSNISKSCRKKLESMIGYQLDHVTLDNLLVPSPYGMNYLYDVNLVLRFLKAFLHKRILHQSPIQLKRVAALLDSYMAEVAPDPCLKPSKFLALATALPDSARESYDEIYRVIDMYLEVHAGLSEEEKMKICCVLNYDKLSPETLTHLSRNYKFPSKSTVEGVISQQFKLKSLLLETNSSKHYTKSSCDFTRAGSKERKDGGNKHIVVYARDIEFAADNEKVRAHLQGMQWRVMELEKMCRKMQTQMDRVTKSKVSSRSSSRSLPKLCS